MYKNLVLIATLFLLFLFNTARATIWYVDKHSKNNSIQAALDSCSTDDTVLVAPGKYREYLVWPNTQGIDLISEFGPETDTIYPQGHGRTGITITNGVDSTTVIRGFTVHYGDAPGISIGGGSSPIIIDNVISMNMGGPGIIVGENSSPIIINNVIKGNEAAWHGGGIACVESSPIIRNNLIINNQAFGGTGGGIYCGASSPVISNNTISDNWGDGIYCTSGSSPLIDSCIISYNVGAGVVCQWNEDANPVINYNNITDNHYMGVGNGDSTVIVDARYNWWGDPSGPGGFGPGTGDEVSQYVDYEPWLTAPFGIVEEIIRPVIHNTPSATIFTGPLLLPEGKKCKVFDITGRTITPDKIKPGIYFIEIEGKITRKVVKVR